MTPLPATPNVAGVPAALRQVVPALQGFMIRAAALSHHDIPSAEISRLEIRHAGRHVARLDGVRLSGRPGRYRLDVARVAGVSNVLRLDDVALSITPSVADATAVVDASLRVLFVDVGIADPRAHGGPQPRNECASVLAHSRIGRPTPKRRPARRVAPARPPRWSWPGYPVPRRRLHRRRCFDEL